MRQRNWIKSAFYRPRDTHGAAWDRLRKEGSVSENVEVPVSWADLITFSHRDVRPRAYMGRLVVLSGDQGFDLRAKIAFPKRKPKSGAETLLKWKPKRGAETLPKWKPKSGAETLPKWKPKTIGKP